MAALLAGAGRGYQLPSLQLQLDNNKQRDGARCPSKQQCFSDCGIWVVGTVFARLLKKFQIDRDSSVNACSCIRSSRIGKKHKP